MCTFASDHHLLYCNADHLVILVGECNGWAISSAVPVQLTSCLGIRRDRFPVFDKLQYRFLHTRLCVLTPHHTLLLGEGLGVLYYHSTTRLPIGAVAFQVSGIAECFSFRRTLLRTSNESHPAG